MVRWLKWPRILWSIAILIFSCGTLQYLVFGSPSFESCVQQEAKSHADEPPRGNNTVASVAVGYRNCLGQFLNENTGAITGLGTLAIAVFTLTLWVVTGKAVRIAREEFNTAQRAFVFIDSFAYELTTAASSNDKNILEKLAPGTDPALFVTRFAVQPIWKNSGSTPVGEMFIRVDWALMDSVGASSRFGWYRGNEARLFLNPQSTTGSEFIETPGLNALIQNGIAGTLGDPPLMLIWGQARYKDVFGGEHWTRWSYRIRPENHAGEGLRVHFIQSGAYNESGDGKIPGNMAMESTERRKMDEAFAQEAIEASKPLETEPAPRDD